MQRQEEEEKDIDNREEKKKENDGDRERGRGKESRQKQRRDRDEGRQRDPENTHKMNLGADQEKTQEKIKRDIGSEDHRMSVRSRRGDSKTYGAKEREQRRRGDFERKSQRPDQRKSPQDRE